MDPLILTSVLIITFGAIDAYKARALQERSVKIKVKPSKKPTVPNT